MKEQEILLEASELGSVETKHFTFHQLWPAWPVLQRLPLKPISKSRIHDHSCEARYAWMVRRRLTIVSVCLCVCQHTLDTDKSD